MIPIRVMLRQCLKHANEWKLAESSGKELTGRQVLINSFVLRNYFRRAVLSKTEKFVGVMLPASLAGTLTNVALTLDKRVAVNLNFTVSEKIMNACIQKTGITHILTSRRLLSKLNYEKLDAEIVIMEDVVKKISLSDKLFGAALAYMPVWAIEKTLGLTSIKDDDLLTIIFTSGSTGVPKGVMLSHNNLYSDFMGFIDMQNMNTDKSILMGMLPLFHSMGYSYNIWSTLCTNFRTAYHYSPLETGEIARMVKKYKCSVIAGAPTFFRTYIRKIAAEDFATITTPLVGAERMPEEVKNAYEAKFGVRPLEAFGCTECAPVVTGNFLPYGNVPDGLPRVKAGSIGIALPGVTVEIRDVDTNQPVAPNTVGMMWTKGPNVMLGYYNEPEKTAEVLVDGWYKTGDLARMDEQGFVFITGRLSRFSKIGGEMVPHEGIERAISEIIDCKPDDPLCLTVTSVSDEKKGEKIIVLYSDLKGFQPGDIIKEMRNREMPPIWIPSTDAFRQVDSIPILGTGKLDIQGSKRLARDITDPLLSKNQPVEPITASVEQAESPESVSIPAPAKV